MVYHPLKKGSKSLPIYPDFERIKKRAFQRLNSPSQQPLGKVPIRPLAEQKTKPSKGDIDHLIERACDGLPLEAGQLRYELEQGRDCKT